MKGYQHYKNCVEVWERTTFKPENPELVAEIRHLVGIGLKAKYHREKLEEARNDV